MWRLFWTQRPKQKVDKGVNVVSPVPTPPASPRIKRDVFEDLIQSFRQFSDQKDKDDWLDRVDIQENVRFLDYCVLFMKEEALTLEYQRTIFATRMTIRQIAFAFVDLYIMDVRDSFAKRLKSHLLDKAIFPDANLYKLFASIVNNDQKDSIRAMLVREMDHGPCDGIFFEAHRIELVNILLASSETHRRDISFLSGQDILELAQRYLDTRPPTILDFAIKNAENAKLFTSTHPADAKVAIDQMNKRKAEFRGKQMAGLFRSNNERVEELKRAANVFFDVFKHDEDAPALRYDLWIDANEERKWHFFHFLMNILIDYSIVASSQSLERSMNMFPFSAFNSDIDTVWLKQRSTRELLPILLSKQRNVIMGDGVTAAVYVTYQQLINSLSLE